MTDADVDVLVPTYERAAALSVTLAGLAGQTAARFRVVVSDQSTAEEWGPRVTPERVRRGWPEWERHRLQNAANLTHLAQDLGVAPGEWRAYKVAWVGGCVLYRRAARLDAGGFSFWTSVPVPHAGEDVVAQLRAMERHGGAGLLPSGAVHLELPTTVPSRDVECYDAVAL